VQGFGKLGAQIVGRAKRLVQYFFIVSLSDARKDATPHGGQVTAAFIGC
jgi:hypothetical protein